MAPVTLTYYTASLIDKFTLIQHQSFSSGIIIMLNIPYKTAVSTVFNLLYTYSKLFKKTYYPKLNKKWRKLTNVTSPNTLHLYKRIMLIQISD